MSTPRKVPCWRCQAWPLSTKQVAIWRLLGDPRELTNVEIVAELNLSLQTVKNLLTALYAVLGVRGRTGAALLLREQEVHLPPPRLDGSV